MGCQAIILPSHQPKTDWFITGFISKILPCGKTTAVWDKVWGGFDEATCLMVLGLDGGHEEEMDHDNATALRHSYMVQEKQRQHSGLPPTRAETEGP